MRRRGLDHSGVRFARSSRDWRVTTPGVWEPSAGGFPALSAIQEQYLILDLALLGISLWSLGEAWQASQRKGPVPRPHRPYA
jgi:hypothetical protein